MNPEDIVIRVQEALRLSNDPLGHRVRVHVSGVREVSGQVHYWQVPVLIDPSESEMYRIYQMLSDVEELLEKQGVKVFLVPAALEFTLASGNNNHG